MRSRSPHHRYALLGLAGALAVCGCNNAPPPPPAPVADLVVDNNRSGALEPGDPTEEAGKNTWSKDSGAIFLANIDDDDRDGKSDAEDSVVNGASDLADLSPILVTAWPAAPMNASGVLSVDALSAPVVRIFRVTGDPSDPASYTAEADPTNVLLSAADLAAGAQFALEGRDLVSSTQPGAWTGIVQLNLTVTVPPASDGDDKAQPVTATDAAQLRVAPLVLQWNTAPTEKVFHTDAQTDTQTLHDGILAASLDAPTEQLELSNLNLEVDVWAQDFYDVGFTSKPGPGGAPVGMRVFIRSAQPDRSAGQVVFKYFLGPDQGAIEKHGDVSMDSGHSYSMNSFGDWDVIPPYTAKDGTQYPLGRNYWGAVPGNPAESPNQGFQDFYRAQKVQPEINVDTSWLMVGHVDEYSSWVKTNTPRGWGMLAASPRMARAMLMQMSTAGNGSVQMFVGKKDYSTNVAKPAAISIDNVLADANLMAESQTAQMHIDTDVGQLKSIIGLDDNEVTEIPFLIENAYGAGLAYQPGTVNLLFVDGKVVIPDPFGPIINNVDPFKADLQQRLGALGVEVHFADDWDTFHEGEGEVHCGTNVARTILSKWWETGR
jgi:protein-arginine deiminase